MEWKKENLPLVFFDQFEYKQNTVPIKTIYAYLPWKTICRVFSWHLRTKVKGKKKKVFTVSTIRYIAEIQLSSL